MSVPPGEEGSTIKNVRKQTPTEIDTAIVNNAVLIIHILKHLHVFMTVIMNDLS